MAFAVFLIDIPTSLDVFSSKAAIMQSPGIA
jgi:hypothetical protein